MESLPLSGQHAPRAFLPPAADMLVAAATSMPLRGISRGVGAPPPTPVHAKRVCKHSQAAEPLKRSLSGTFYLLLKKQDKIRGVGAPPPTEKARCACYGFSRFCKPRTLTARRFRTGRFAAFFGASGRCPVSVHAKREK